VPALRRVGQQPRLLFLQDLFQDLFDDVDLQVALGQEPPQPGVLFLQLAEAVGLGGGRAAEARQR